MNASSPLRKPQEPLGFQQARDGARTGVSRRPLEPLGRGPQPEPPCQGSSPPTPNLPYLEGLGPGDEVGKVEVLDVVASDHIGVHDTDEGRPGLRREHAGSPRLTSWLTPRRGSSPVLGRAGSPQEQS